MRRRTRRNDFQTIFPTSTKLFCTIRMRQRRVVARRIRSIIPDKGVIPPLYNVCARFTMVLNREQRGQDHRSLLFLNSIAPLFPCLYHHNVHSSTTTTHSLCPILTCSVRLPNLQNPVGWTRHSPYSRHFLKPIPTGRKMAQVSDTGKTDSHSAQSQLRV
jgi:hypothetical protein